MCSFEVCSLFINVPLDETIQICPDKLYALHDSPAIPRPVLKKLLEFATKKSHFIFDGQYYDQIDVVAMGTSNRLITLSTDKHYSLDPEDDFRSGCRNVSHQQQFFSELLSPGRSHYKRTTDTPGFKPFPMIIWFYQLG